ncbi:hypothetical protein JOQ06_007941, partial [Pogonophryne albipinna]
SSAATLTPPTLITPTNQRSGLAKPLHHEAPPPCQSSGTGSLRASRGGGSESFQRRRIRGGNDEFSLE